MVIRIGASEVGPSVSTLVRDVRNIMEPHTASRLRERKSNRLKDYVTMAGPLGVTQLLLFSRSEQGATNLRIARCPRGPTLHFRVNDYSLCRDIRRALRNPKSPGKEFAAPPLLVMNSFAAAVPPNPDGTPGRSLPQDALLTSMFQSMFPAISAQRTPISSIRRVLLLNRRPAAAQGASEYIIDVRHYAISTKSVGLSRPIRRINAAERRVHRGVDPKGKGGVPNLGKLEDIADYMLDPGAAAAGGGYTSESEVEEDAQVEVLNPAVRGAKRKRLPRGPEKRSIHLLELGPRMTLEMVKIEDSLADGKTLWHAYEKKTKEEVQELERRHAKRQAEKEKRRKEQQANVRAKKEALEAKDKEKKTRRSRGEDARGDDEDEEMWDDEELDELHQRGCGDDDGDDGDVQDDEDMEQ